MPKTASMPLVGVAASYSTDNPNRHPLHTTSDKYLRCVIDGAGALPVAIPALGEMLDVGRIADSLDGLLLPGGRANIEPHHYGGPAFPDDEYIDKTSWRALVTMAWIFACWTAVSSMPAVVKGHSAATAAVFAQADAEAGQAAAFEHAASEAVKL